MVFSHLQQTEELYGVSLCMCFICSVSRCQLVLLIIRSAVLRKLCNCVDCQLVLSSNPSLCQPVSLPDVLNLL
jgi:hypothetical protein